MNPAEVLSHLKHLEGLYGATLGEPKYEAVHHVAQQQEQISSLSASLARSQQDRRQLETSLIIADQGLQVELDILRQRVSELEAENAQLRQGAEPLESE
ncbi:hypothetical protein SS50377_23993 [Spironucleus salmonicida]|uniref:Uncharacterized protein n=1 Tax=Spironucleus salmonicida TaxID=348837 RepID=A0A9P8LTM5_9EUKA|nr:hypothetical protein SS50377_23982 [Spironucleus salmonicida]KAH0574055.1 hypothetical protein SS50377_23993 [Spironucleus salmonicida]